MPNDRTPIAGRSQANSNASATNSPLNRWSGRSAAGRRCKDLYKSYWKQAGNPTEPSTQAAILALAEQFVIAEQARAACLADGGLTKINLELAARFENLANRTLKRLKLDKVTPSTKGKSSWRDRAEAAQRAADETAAADQSNDPPSETPP